MNPEFLPEVALLIFGILIGGVAINRLFPRRWGEALRLGATSLALIGLAILGGKYAHWKYSETWRLRETTKRYRIVPSIPVSPDEEDAKASQTTSLLLGGVNVKVVASDRYVLSASNEPFLTLDSLASGMLVSCDVAGSHSVPIRTPRLAARVRQNVITYSGPDVRPTRPDAHTILVREGDKDILRVHYADPRTIEVTGQFYLAGNAGPGVISLMHGLRWRGGTVSPGTGVDLRLQGKGSIDFEPSGMIQIMPQ